MTNDRKRTGHCGVGGLYLLACDVVDSDYGILHIYIQYSQARANKVNIKIVLF